VKLENGKIIRGKIVASAHTEEELTEKSRLIFETRIRNLRDVYISELEKGAKEIVDGPLSIYSVQLVDVYDEVIVNVTQPAKIKKYNSFKNNLILRNFTSKADHLIGSSQKDETQGRLIVLYTTPLGDEYIEKLTSKYRLYCFFIILGVALIYIYLVKYLLIPVKRVIGRLDEAKTMPPGIIQSPGSYLERVYNDMSRDALLSRVNHKINEFASDDLIFWQVAYIVCRE